MAKKKIVGDDSKTYTVKEKKPIFKRVWFWILIIIIAIIAFSQLGGGSSDKNSTKSSDAKSSQSATSTSKKDTSKIGRADYNAIKVGDLMKNGEGGTTLAELTKKWGKPSDTSTDTLDNVKTDMDTWDNVDGELGANMVVQFTNDKTVDKAITSLKVDRAKKIALSDFEGIANGTKEADIVKKFGEPNGISENVVDGKVQKMLEYTSGVKGDLGANFSITLDNGIVTGKTQTSMK